jgi:hypothetical protein
MDGGANLSKALVMKQRHSLADSFHGQLAHLLHVIKTLNN